VTAATANSPNRPTVEWPTRADTATYQSVHRVVAAVAALGGAVGWLHVPSVDEVADWLDGVLVHVAAGRSRLALARDPAGAVQALGYWARFEAAVLAHNAEIRKVMTHPDARGAGLGRTVVRALVDDARGHGVETVVLDVRGNNHGAMRLYESEGFEVWGRLPDFVAVGDERFDRLSYRRDLHVAGGLVRHGGRVEGPGASYFPALSTHPGTA
jgi:ribosomal protein S18 acetylase RimI-like enzyme